MKSLKNKKIYTGITNNSPKERLKQHNNGSNIFSRQNRPFELLYFEAYICKTDALNREKFYKSGFGRKIRDLIISSAVSAKGGSASG